MSRSPTSRTARDVTTTFRDAPCVAGHPEEGTTMAKTNASIKRTTEYKTLVAILGTEDKALAAYKATHPEAAPAAPAAPSAFDQLVAAGYTKEQAEVALAATTEAPAAAPAPVVVTSKDAGDTLRESKGFAYAKGRVYGDVTLAETIIRVHRTGTPQIVTSKARDGKAVLVYKEETGDVALQNLVTPRA